jgi:hypothetical protein
MLRAMLQCGKALNGAFKGSRHATSDADRAIGIKETLASRHFLGFNLNKVG